MNCEWLPKKEVDSLFLSSNIVTFLEYTPQPHKIKISNNTELILPFLFQLVHYDLDRSFFELYRFDFIVDENLDIHLLKVNMNPNLSSTSLHDAEMNEDVLRNLLNLIGLRSYEDTFDENNVRVRSEICNGSECIDSCRTEKCSLCWQCLDDDERFDLQMAFGEQKRIGSLKRLFPNVNLHSFFMSDFNKQHTNWFKFMCKENRVFC